MRKLAIKQITMKNFKCFKHAIFDFDQKNIKVSGDNETGKTSIYDAFCWCLFGKNSANEKSFEYKCTSANNGEDVFVEVITSFDGREIAFKRLYEAKFTRMKEFNGYSTNCFVNGIPKSVRDFENEIFHVLSIGIEEFNILTNPKYLTENLVNSKGILAWQKRRNFLYGLVEFKTDAELAEEKEAFLVLKNVLNKYSDISEYIQALKYDISKINKEIENIPSRIDQQSKNIEKVEYTEAEVMEEREKIKIKGENVQRSMDAQQLERKKILNLELELKNLEYDNKEFKAKQREKYIQSKKKELSAAKKEFEDEKLQIKALQEIYNQKWNEAQARKTKYLTGIDKMKNIVADIEKQKHTPTNEKICPLCHQKIGKDITQEELEYIKKLQKKQKEYEQKLQEISIEIQDVEAPDKTKLCELKQKYEKVFEEYSDVIEIKENLPDYENKKKNIQTEIEIAKKSLEEKILYDDNEKRQYQQEFEEIQSKIAVIEKNKKAQFLLDELQREINKYLVEKDNLQEFYDRASAFIQYKCEKITDSLNDCFSLVNWNLFKFNKTDAELKEYCEAEINGRAYGDLSNSTKVLAGLDIINAFQKHFNIALPIFIDNAESISEIPTLQGQTILLYVESENCPKCGKSTKKRTKDLYFECAHCGHRFNKNLKIQNV